MSATAGIGTPNRRSVLAGRPVDELSHDVEVAHVAGVLLHDVEQDREERRRRALGEAAAGRGEVGGRGP